MDIDMDIKELEAFVYVVENCSFSRAAELLHLTQPTISSHISALERKLGIKLVVRTTKETYPSDAGKLLYRYAKEILQVRENAAAALKSFSQEMRGTITLAASTVPSQYYLPHLLQNFHEKYPDIAFNIQMEDSPKVVELDARRGDRLQRHTGGEPQVHLAGVCRRLHGGHHPEHGKIPRLCRQASPEGAFAERDLHQPREIQRHLSGRQGNFRAHGR